LLENHQLPLFRERAGFAGLLRPVSVVDNAAKAALEDPRFNPVRPEELPGMDLEISLLTPPVVIPSYADYDVARHGIILIANGHHAVYLPEVAPGMGLPAWAGTAPTP